MITDSESKKHILVFEMMMSSPNCPDALTCPECHHLYLISWEDDGSNTIEGTMFRYYGCCSSCFISNMQHHENYSETCRILKGYTAKPIQ